MKNYFYSLCFLLVIFSTSCKKKDSDPAPSPSTQTGSPSAPVPTKTYYFSALIGSKPVVIETSNAQSASDNISGPNNLVQRSAIFLTSYPSTENSMELTFYKYFPGQITIPAEQLYSLMAPGTYAYTYANGSQTLPGISISWTDENNVKWTTYNGSKDQSNSTFKITSRSEYQSAWTPVYIQAEFNCTLYNDAGQSKTLTNGKYKGFGIPFF